MAEVEQCMRFDFMGVPISTSAVPLLEPAGTLRWMTSKLAEKYAQERAAAGGHRTRRPPWGLNRMQSALGAHRMEPPYIENDTRW